MLNWISSRLKGRSDDTAHPLGSDAAIDAWLAEIPLNQAQHVLPAVAEWLSDPEHLAQQLDLPALLRALTRLDEFAQNALDTCWQDLWQEARKEKPGPLPLRALENHYRHAWTSNRYLFQRLATDPQWAEDKRQLTRCALRAMHAWTQLKKLSRIAYRAPDDNWWQEAHALLRAARAQGVSHQTHLLYGKTGTPSSPWKEYMAALLLETAPLTNLSCQEIEATDRLCRWIEPRSQYVAMPSPLTFFQIAYEGNAGPNRQPENASADPAFRYLGPGAGYAQLIQLRSSLVSDGICPPWLESAGLDREALKKLLHTLITHWSPNAPTRGQPRRQAAGRIRVVNGLTHVRRMIAASEFARSGRKLDYEGHLKSLQFRHKGHAVVEDVPPPPKTPLEVLQLLETAGDRQMMDQWEIIDVSEKGMGVRCFTRRPWQNIGALVAWRRENELDWQIGIIRRLGSSHGVPNAGLITFAGTPYCSQVRVSKAEGEENLWGQQTAETSGLGWRDAVMLSFEDRLLLAPPGTYAVDHRIDISIRGHFRPARVTSLEASGNDYELIGFRVAGEARDS